MRIYEFLSKLRSLGAEISADGDNLRFSAPKGTITPELRAQLTERKEEILSFLREIDAGPITDLSPIVSVARSEDLPLSFAQQRLWFLDQLEPGLSAYNIASAICLDGLLNAAALQQALREIVRRHEALRTTFSTVNDLPVQVIDPDYRMEVPVIDLRQLPEDEREAEATRLLIEQANLSFDLEHGPILRALLLRLEAQKHYLIFVVHHIAYDAWSTRIFKEELSRLYEAFSTGRPSPLPELSIQYADFAVWQRKWLEGPKLESLVSYWQKKLGDNPPALEFTTDHPRPAVLSYNGGVVRLPIPDDLSDALRSLGRKERATLFMTLLTAFKALLYRYTGQEDISVGSPIANRNRLEIEGLIGFFTNTLVLRTELSGNPTFREFLKQVRETALEAYEYQDLPFEKLVEELSPERSLNRNPIFQVLFVLRNTTRDKLEFSGLTLSSVGMPHVTAKFDLTLTLVETNEGLRSSIEYNSDIFDESTIVRMLNHYKILLESIAADPDQRISDLPILMESEKRQLLVEWNDTQKAYALEKCVHQFFEEQVEKTPDAIAVTFKNEDLTYKELNKRANQLAHHMRMLGIGPDAPVGICLERSLDMVVGLLGILKAGGAYVPIDPAYPKERLAFMLSDSRASVLLTQERILEQLPEQDLQVICLDRDSGKYSEESVDNPDSEVTSQNLAYIIYTSGSTGQPKGVALGHLPLANLMFWQLESPTFFGKARVLQFASLSFDASFHEMFSTWGSGGTMVLISDEDRKDSQALLDVLIKEKIERLFLPFVALQQLAQTSEASGLVPTSLREVVTAGEQLQITPAIANLFEKLENCVMHNDYGPSESHVVTAYTLTGPVSDWPLLPPIGKAISNTQIYILDSHLQITPIGVPGELHIAGVSLARGYHHQPDLTAEKFIPNPFSYDPEARLYKTGDLARYLPDGNIEFLGRLDNQVKIRGFRVEPGEIETVLGKSPAVHQAVVMAREDQPGSKRLVAYVVPDEAHSLTVSELFQFLREKLPDYMVPSTFMLLDALPLTPSGKIDRRALPEPDMTRPELAQEYVPPRTPVEQQIADIWAEVLGLEQIGIYDDFFELGGHSLMATQVISRMREAFQAGIPLRVLFEIPTVASLAEFVEIFCSTTETSDAKSGDTEEMQEDIL